MLMDALRKSIGVLIIIFLGIPILVGIIWTVGLTKAVVTPEFLSDLPREIIKKIPDMVDEVLEEVDREDMVDDPNGRAWVKAAVEADTSFKELMKKTGLLDWMENELSDSLKQMGEMLRGEIPARTIVLDLRPLKQALRHEAIKEYLVDLLKNLPPCDEDQLEEWVEAAANPRDLEDLPACRPTDLESAAQAINFVQDHEIEDIPDEVNIFEHVPSFPKGVDLIHGVLSFTYLLFLIPAFFIVIASLIGGTTKSGFFRWMGISTLIGGILAFALSSLLKHAIPWAIGILPEAHGITSFEKVMVGKAGDIGILVIEQLLSAVNSVAGVVCLIGIVLFAFSYLLPSDTRPEQRTEPETQTPQPTVKETGSKSTSTSPEEKDKPDSESETK
jgi:hypothetical protein